MILIIFGKIRFLVPNGHFGGRNRGFWGRLRSFRTLPKSGLLRQRFPIVSQREQGPHFTFRTIELQFEAQIEVSVPVTTHEDRRGRAAIGGSRRGLRKE